MAHQPEAATGVTASSVLVQSTDCFYRDLPRLLRSVPGAWVAYHGEHCLGDPLSGSEERCLRGHGAWVSDAAFSPDRRRIASASADQSLKVWDVDVGSELLALRFAPRDPTAVAFSPDGKRLAFSAEEGTIQVYESEPLSPEHLARREAASVVNFLLHKHASRADVLEDLRQMPLDEAVRQAARDLLAAKPLPAKGSARPSPQADPKPGDATPLPDRAYDHALSRHWDKAAVDFDRWLKLTSPGDPHLTHQQACLAYLARQTVACRQITKALLQRGVNGPRDLTALYMGARAAALPTEPTEPAERVVELAKQSLAANPGTPYHLYTVALTLYRAGIFEAAIEHAQRSLNAADWPGKGLDWLLLAMARKHLGKDDEARRCLEKADHWFQAVTQDRRPFHPCDWLEFQILRGEAEDLFGPSKIPSPK